MLGVVRFDRGVHGRLGEGGGRMMGGRLTRGYSLYVGVIMDLEIESAWLCAREKGETYRYSCSSRSVQSRCS